MAGQQGFAHLMLSVQDAGESAAWYRKVFGAESAFSGKDDYSPVEVVAAGGLQIGFRSHPGTGSSDRFDETRVGMDHVAVLVAGDEIEEWRARLDELGVAHSGIIEDPFGKHLNFRDPDNIPLELYAPPA